MSFDPSKESKHVLHRRRPFGEAFRILGVLWDTKLTMLLQCQEVAQRAGWKLRTLLRTRRFFTTAELVRLYKSHVLPILEFPTPAVFHAASSVLNLLDRIQRRFLREVGLTEQQALLHFNLAPLNCRRDIAALGLVHRTVLGEGPPHFSKWFYLSGKVAAYNTRLQERKHNKQLHDYLQGTQTEFLRRSLLGVATVYNNLPQKLVDFKTVKLFQRNLQLELKNKAKRDSLGALTTTTTKPWQLTYSLRTGYT